MADIKWIKIVTDIFDDEKILLIESMPEADSIIVIWFKLLCLAGRQNNSGVFLLNGCIPYTEEMFATIFRRKLNTVRLALNTFEQYGMIEIINDTVTIPNWSKHQTLDKIERNREYMKNYMREKREEQRQLADCQSNCKTNSKINSQSNVSAAEKNREEIDKNKKEERKKTASGFDEVIAKYTSNEELRQALIEFIKMRKLIKKPLTDRALKLTISKLDSLASTDAEKIDILNESITHNWLGVFPLKEEQKKQRSSKQETERERISREQDEMLIAFFEKEKGDGNGGH